ncbi:MAG: ribbon-helix-helix domain-containing protein [Hyphomicrobiales bacterium]|nr:ribbon-helix-helix domain-containing protein [Hyphomicrobiales bacterium]
MLRKHSISIRGHKTSYSLEDEFYVELTRIANQNNIPLSRMITRIDSIRKPGINLSSALRLYVLNDLKSSRTALDQAR